MSIHLRFGLRDEQFTYQLVNKKKKFRSRGGRDGALSAMKQLEEDNLGKLVVKKCKGSIKVFLHITTVDSPNNGHFGT